MISEEKLSEIREKLPLSELIGEYVALKKSGKSFKGPCPFHQEKTPSFYVHDERGSFHCFGCSAGGDLFEFLKKIEGISFPEAVSRLAERTGVALEIRGDFTLAHQEHRQQLLEINRQAAWYYHCLLKKLPSEHEAWQYLHARQLKDQVLDFFLGFCPHQDSKLKNYLKQKGFSEKLMEESGLFRGPREFFRGRVLFPIFRQDRKVVGFGGRRLDDKSGGPKYINSAESPLFKKGELFFGLEKAKTTIRKIDTCLIVEGYIDVIALHSQGFTQTIAPLGTALTEQHAKKLKRLTKEVVLLFDGDAAGQNAALKSLEVLLAQSILPFYASLPAGEDPDSYLRRWGRLGLEKKLQEKRNLLEEMIDKTSLALKGSQVSLAERGQRAQELWNLIKRIPERITRHLYRRHLAESMDLTETWMEENIESSAPLATQKTSALSPAALVSWLAEEEALIEIWLKFPRLRRDLQESLQPKDFWSKSVQTLTKAFWQLEENSPGLSAGEIFKHAPDELLEFLSKLALRSGGLEEESIAEYYLEQTVLRLKEKRLRLELATIQKNLGPSALEQQAEIQAKIRALSQLLQNQGQRKERNYGQGQA